VGRDRGGRQGCSSDTLHDRFERLAKAAGVRPLVLHGSRHTYATLALASGVRPDLASRALGHASVAFTLDVYTHPSGAEELAAADRIGEALKPPASNLP
jgi:integrase